LLFWLGLLLLAIVALGLVQAILMPFATGFAIAYVLAPLVTRIEPGGSAAAWRACLSSPLPSLLALILLILVPLIQGQIVQLITRVPNLVRYLQDSSASSSS